VLADAAVPLADDVFNDTDTRGDKHHSGRGLHSSTFQLNLSRF